MMKKESSHPHKSIHLSLALMTMVMAIYMLLSIPIMLYRSQGIVNNYNNIISKESSRISNSINSIISTYLYRSIQLSTMPDLLQNVRGYTTLNNTQIADFRQQMPRLIIDLQYTTGYPEPFVFYLDTPNGISGLYIKSINDLEQTGMLGTLLEKKADAVTWDNEVREYTSNSKKYLCLVFYKNLTQFAGYPLVLEGAVPYNYFESLMMNLPLPAGYTVLLRNSGGQSVHIGNAEPNDEPDMQDCFYSRSKLSGGLGEIIVALPKSLLYRELIYTLLLLVGTAAFTNLLIWVATVRVINDTRNKLVSFIDSLKSSKEFSREMASSTIGRLDRIDAIQQNYLGLVSIIKQATDELAEAKTQVSKLELELLQERLNPHMLYNSLSLIKWTALRNSDTRTANIVDLLSRYYRAALNRGEDIITVTDELKMASDYIEIMNLNRRAAYALSYSIDKQIGEMKVIKNILQTAVENAIVHALLERNEGTISITATTCGQDITFYITDDGCGFPSDIISSILDLTYDNTYSGYGLKNLIKRIKLHCGEQYGIDIQSVSGQGTTVVIRTRAMN